MRTRWTLLVVTLAAAFARLGEANGPEKPPNIVLFVLDDVGYETLDFWPYQPFPPGVMGDPPTPVLRSLADGGIVFTNAWASPVCSPSRMQILTGRHAHRTGVGGLVGRDAPLRIDDTELFLPEVIKVLGNPNSYHTGAFGKWHIAPLQSPDGTCNLGHATRNGFDIFQGHMWNVSPIPGIGGHFSWERVDSATPVPCGTPLPMVTEWSAKVTRRDVQDWITSLPPDEPFFAYVAFNAPHEPLQVPPLERPPFGSLSDATLDYILGTATTPPLINPATGAPYIPGQGPGTDSGRLCAGDPTPPGYDYAQTFGRHVEVFNWMVEAFDTEIGKIMRRLSNLGRLENTIIIVISDNGTSGRSLDCPLETQHAKGSVYQLGARVPLIVWGQPVISPENAGSACDELVAAVDLWPTIAEMAGVSDPGQYLAQVPVVPESYTLDGVSFSHLIADPSAGSLRSYALIEYFRGHERHHDVAAPDFKRSVVEASGYRYVQQFWGLPPMGNAPDELLHIPSDPGETINLAAFGLPMQGRSPCPPSACPGQLQEIGDLLKVSCPVPYPPTPSPPCDLMPLFDLFNGYYGPLLCPCLTTN